jgi:hypothetical protein
VNLRLVTVASADAMEDRLDFIKAVNPYWHYAQGVEFSVFGEPQILTRLSRIACKTHRSDGKADIWGCVQFSLVSPWYALWFPLINFQTG